MLREGRSHRRTTDGLLEAVPSAFRIGRGAAVLCQTPSARPSPEGPAEARARDGIPVSEYHSMDSGRFARHTSGTNPGSSERLGENCSLTSTQGRQTREDARPPVTSECQECLSYKEGTLPKENQRVDPAGAPA